MQSYVSHSRGTIFNPLIIFFFFFVIILLYQFVTKNIKNYRKFDIFFNFCFTVNKIFLSIVENHEKKISFLKKKSLSLNDVVSVLCLVNFMLMYCLQSSSVGLIPWHLSTSFLFISGCFYYVTDRFFCKHFFSFSKYLIPEIIRDSN